MSGSPEDHSQLVKGLNSPFPEKRAATLAQFSSLPISPKVAAKLLQKPKTKSLASLIVSLLSDENESVQGAAVCAVCSHLSQKTLPIFLTVGLERSALECLPASLPVVASMVAVDCNLLSDSVVAAVTPLVLSGLSPTTDSRDLTLASAEIVVNGFRQESQSAALVQLLQQCGALAAAGGSDVQEMRMIHAVIAIYAGNAVPVSHVLPTVSFPMPSEALSICDMLLEALYEHPQLCATHLADLIRISASVPPEEALSEASSLATYAEVLAVCESAAKALQCGVVAVLEADPCAAELPSVSGTLIPPIVAAAALALGSGQDAAEALMGAARLLGSLAWERGERDVVDMPELPLLLKEEAVAAQAVFLLRFSTGAVPVLDGVLAHFTKWGKRGVGAICESLDVCFDCAANAAGKPLIPAVKAAGAWLKKQGNPQDGELAAMREMCIANCNPWCAYVQGQ
ncbi:hypothetical protein KIPB_000414 [Kipferlia bialata]|uniref:Uncharacterized protein n=1 Tax=Kipferlia bialata TaxID=797122 RepID=A0A391NI37_9EUKA|nr:hypothetical protein KIPB_000414 [Kipferlia bialata]|eukprot:g414.t1